MMKKYVETLIIGASYFGIGYASTHPDCLILEPSQILGGDFHKGLRTADISGLSDVESRIELGEMMKQYGVWKEDRFDVLKAAPVLHAYVSKTKDIHLLLNVKVLSVQRTEDGYGVEYLSNSGIHPIRCSRVLDTTVLRDTDPAGAGCVSKTLNLFTLCLNESVGEKLRSVCPECVTEAGMNPGEMIVKIPIHPGETLAEAYEAVIELWKKAFPDGEEKILFVAGDFDYVCEPVNEDLAPCPWNSQRFPNPLTAFVKGMEAE